MLGMMSEGLADELEVYINTNPDKSLLPKKPAQRNRTMSGRRLQEKVIMVGPDSATIYTCWFTQGSSIGFFLPLGKSCENFH